MNSLNEELFISSSNKYTLRYQSAILNESYKIFKDDIAYSKISIFLILFLHALHLIIRITAAIFPVGSQIKYRFSFTTVVILLIVAIVCALAELLVNVIKKLRDIRGLPSIIMCQFVMFYGSHEMYYIIDNGGIIFDLSYTFYIYCTILIGLIYSRNYFIWNIAYLVCLIFTLIYYFNQYKTSIFFYCIYTFYIIFYYTVLIFINYSYEYISRIYVFTLMQQKKEINEWQNFFHNFSIAIFIVVQNAILHINKRCAQVLGLKESNSKKLIDLRSNQNLEKEVKNKLKKFSNEENKEENILDLIDKEDNEKDKFYFSRKCGKVEKYYELSRFNIHMEGQKCSVFAITDQTSSWILSKEQLNKKDDKKNSFVSITHDMKNPLGSIITGLKNVLPLSYNDEVTGAMLTSISCAELLLCSVNDILDLSKFENNKLTMSFNEINIREVIKDCLNLMNINYKEKNLQLNGFFSEDLPETIVSDKVRIKGIVLNLLSNALKFTRQGKVDVKVEFREIKRMVKISVRDTGKGIAPENFSKMFQFYGKLEGNEVENPYGNGIGLAFSRNIAKLLGGDIKFDSRVNIGTKFVFWCSINANVVDTSQANLEPRNDIFSNVSLTLNDNERTRKLTSHQLVVSTERPINQNNMQNQNLMTVSPQITGHCLCPRVVIVDDMDHIHIVMRRQLIKLAISAYDCYSGEELIDYLNNYSLPLCCKGIQIIFLDMHMDPGINGLETASILKEKMSIEEIPRITIIGLSADLIEQHIMDEVEVKPLSQEKLSYFVQKYILE